METVVRSVWTPVIKNLDIVSRTIRFVGTKETEDRTGDIIEVDGWELSNFTKNPVFLWDHNPGEGPIGKVKQIIREGNALLFDVEFASKAVSEFADQVFKLFEAGFLNAVSVGFIPKEFEPIIEDDGFMSGIRFTKQELLELSAVSIPAHQDALAASAFKKALEHRAEIKGYTSLEEFTKTALAKLMPEANEEDEEMTKEQGDLLLKEVEELKMKVEGLVTLQETVELSKTAMTTLNTLFAEKLGKSDETNVSKAVSSEEGQKPAPASESVALTSALTALLDKVQKGTQAQFKTEGDK
ncbi:MAG: HK97 family phage prohead protease [Planctomycetota bacterium]|jgi:HK97 family phage prohead protease